jgi:uncharacterized protein
MKTVYLIHGWEGYPENNWFPWLKTNLENQGIKVVVPAMPDSDNPKKDVWVQYLKDLAPDPDSDTYFVGHSMGCRTILRYLEDLPGVIKVGGVVLVAGWVTVAMWEGRTEEETKVIEDWIQPAMNFEKVRQHSPSFTAIFSDNDPFVPSENQEAYREGLHAEIIVKKGMGHFSDDDKITELPEVLSALNKMMQ